MKNDRFVAEHISRGASIMLHSDVATVFPLFGPFEERKWAAGWDPTAIYPETEDVMEGTTFRTGTHGNREETENIWIVTKYRPENHLIQYLVSTPNRHWFITVECSACGQSQTMARVTYSYTGLNAGGNRMNCAALEGIYRHSLKDWELAINHYLKHGTLLQHP